MAAALWKHLLTTVLHVGLNTRPLKHFAKWQWSVRAKTPYCSVCLRDLFSLHGHQYTLHSLSFMHAVAGRPGSHFWS